MKEKKNTFLKYLKDDSFINKKKSNQSSIDKLSLDKENNNKRIGKNHSSENYINIEDNYSFDNFVFGIKNYDCDEKSRWDNPARKYAVEMDNNKNKIKLTELNQINFKNPLLILNKEYIHKDYNQNLFHSELSSIENSIKNLKNKNIDNNADIIINDNNLFVEKIMEKREKLEIYRKILNYYLQYYCQNNIELITPSMSKIRELTKIVDFYYDKIHSKTKKGLLMKKYIIDKSMEILLKKKRIDNLKKIHFFLKNDILKNYRDIKNLKLKKMNFNYIKYYEENNRLLKDIEEIEKDLLEKYNKDNNQKKECKLKIIEEMKRKLYKKKEKFNKIYNYEKNNIFESKKSHIVDLYHLFNIEHNINNSNKSENKTGLFFNEMKKNYKLVSKKIILENIQYFKNKESPNSNKVLIFNLNKPKLSEINNVNIEEKNIIPCLSKILVKLKNHLDIFLYYYELICNDNTDIKYEIFKNEIKSRKNEFYEVLDKHLSKSIILLSNITGKKEEKQDFSKKIVLILINLICLFEKLLKIKFKVKYNKYINFELKNFIIDLVKLENKNVIEKAITLLSNENWEKKVLDASFFQYESINKKIPFHLKKFISFFNESEIKESLTSQLITKDNIDDIFNYCINFLNDNNINESINNINFEKILNLNCIKEINKRKKEIDIENNIIIFNKPLNYNSLFCIESSLCIIEGIEEQIINLILFESLTDEIFEELFNAIDIYIFTCFKMFLKDKNYISKLLKDINLKEIEKDMGNLDYWSEVVSYQKKYMEFKKFYFLVQQKICDFFGEDKEYTTEEDKESFIDDFVSKGNELSKLKTVNEEEKKFSLSKSYNNIINNLNIFSLRKNNNLNLKENNDINKNKIINNEDQKNYKDDNINEENEDDIEPLNINQINEINNNDFGAQEKDKNDRLKFFNFFRSNNDNQEVPIEELMKEVKAKLSSIKIKETIILISSISTIKKILKRLVSFTTKIELELQRYQILNKINKYEKLIEQIRNLFYEKISSEILDFSKISYLIVDYNWSPNPEEGSSQLFEASKWVNKLKSLFEVIVCEIHNKFNEEFGQKKLTQYFTNLIKYIIECVQDSFSKIKKFNDMGRSIMLKDFKHLKEGIDNTLKKNNYSKNIKTNMIFDILIQYANAWYYNSDELINFTFNYNIKYKYFESLMNSSPKINDLSSELKNELINKVKQNYISQFKKFISKLKDDN